MRLNGRLNIESLLQLRDRLLAISNDRSAKNMIMDLMQVSYIDSSGIATMIEDLNFQWVFVLRGRLSRTIPDSRL